MIFSKSHFQYFIIFLFFSLPLVAAGEMKDYLLVSGTCSLNGLTVDHINQKVLETSDINPSVGEYVLELTDNSKIISSAKFDCASDYEAEAVSEDRYETTRLSEGDYIVALVLEDSVSAESGRLAIKEAGKVLVQKAITDLNWNISGSQKFSLEKAEEPFPPFPKEKNKNWLWIDLIALVVLAAIVASIVWAIKAIRRKIKLRR